MDFNIKSGQPEKRHTDCLILPVFESVKSPIINTKLEKSCREALTNILKLGDTNGKVGQNLLLHNIPGINSDRVLLVGCGKESEFNDKVFREVIQKMATSLNNTGVREAICYLTEIPLKDYDSAWKIQQAVMITVSSRYLNNLSLTRIKVKTRAKS